MAELITRVYSGFRGVDFRGEEINLMRSPDSLNVWKNYKETESIRTRPGMKLQTAFADKVYGIFFYKNMQIVHSGTALYRIVAGEKTILRSGVKAARSEAFVYENKWYFKDGVNYLEYDGLTIKDIEGYVPTTTIGRKPMGGGTKYQDVNMLQARRKNSFLADGTSVEYHLDATNIDEIMPKVTVDGKETREFSVDYGSGVITFNTAPAAPLTDGQDNVVVEFSRTVSGYRDTILKCNMLQMFDNRVFFSGNPDHPNTIWHCSLDDPGYCSDQDYYREGLDEASVRGLVAGNNALWVFREPSQTNTTIFYHTPIQDEEYGKIYPSSHSSIAIGCVGKAVNFGDDIVFFSDRGMEGISSDITTEQVAAHRSSLVDRKLIIEPKYKDMLLAEWEGYLFVFVGNKAYLADSRTAFNNEGHIEYDWYYWDMLMDIESVCVQGGVMYLGTADGVYTLNDYNASVESWWTTPKDKFKSPNKQKTTNKRGCVSEGTGDVTVLAKTEDTDFEEVGAFEGVTDYFVTRIKQKKFKDLQLKFYSGTRFSLETVTLECFLGGYIKR
jgi:hypothetical protein